MIFLHLIPLCAVGGESTVGAVGGPTYVSSNGTNDTQCLNGGASHPCKTLGYVLLHLSGLQCTNCTVMVTYSHEAFPVDNSSQVHITLSLQSLHIAGVNFPKLTFSGHTVVLHGGDTTTDKLVMENVELANCGVDMCMETEPSGSYYVGQFNLLNVTMSNVGPLHIVAHNLLYMDCSFHDIFSGDQLFVVELAPPFYNATIVNCSFEGPAFGYVKVNITNSPFLTTVTISHCIFTNFSFDGFEAVHNYVAIFLSIDNATIDIDIEDCVFQTNQYSSLISLNATSSLIKGNVSITNNRFIRNIVHDLYDFVVTGLIVGSFFGNSFSLERLGFYIDTNAFINNTGPLVYINSLPKFILQNSNFIGNIRNGNLVHIVTSKNPNVQNKIQNIIFDQNAVDAATFVAANKAAIALIEGGGSSYIFSSTVLLCNVTFTFNRGTPLAVDGVYLLLNHSVRFISNNALTGGGLYIDGKTRIDLRKNSSMEFLNNTALYGGAIYIDIEALIAINGPVKSDGNTALMGNSVFVVGNCNTTLKYLDSISKEKITCTPAHLSVGTNNSISLFPGQIITLRMTVTDTLSRHSACTADVFLLCNGIFCHHYYLVGPPTTFLTSDVAVLNGLRLKAKTMTPPTTVKPQLRFVCRAPTAVLPAVFNVTIEVLDCPLGFSYNSTSQQCNCRIYDSALFVCSDQYGEICVKKGYWYGELNGTITISKCIQSLCNFKQACPSEVAPNPTGYALLASQDQCLNGHGGILCTNCSEGHIPTYDMLQCIPSYRCANWHPYFLLLLFIVCPLLVGIILLFAVQLRLGIGSGYLYGPIFYLAVLNRIPLDLSAPLSIFVSVVTESFLLNMKVLGFIPWCFFDLPPFPIKCLKLIPPTVLLILVAFIAKCAPRLFQRFFRKLPTEGICLLTLISFWSLATTCIEIITPVHLPGIHNARVYFSPDLMYFHTVEHIALCVVAFIILIVFGCVTVVLMISPFVSTFHRLKPLLDEFQSCYKDNCRWYGGVYFVSWIILEVFLILSDYLIFQTLLVVLTVAHFSIQPYIRKWLNITDGVLLVSLVFTTSLSLANTTGREGIVLMCLSILAPLTYIAFGVVAILLIRCGVISRMKQLVQSWKNKRRCVHNVTNSIQDPAIPYTTSVTLDRDSLIGILQEEEYGTFDHN